MEKQNINSLLVLACEFGDLDKVKELFEMHSDVLDDVIYEFICACENYHFDIAKFLLDMKPSEDIINCSKADTILELAFERNNFDFVELFLKLEFINANEIDIGYVFCQVCRNRNLDGAKWLHNKFNIHYLLKDKAFEYAVQNNHDENIQWFVSINTDYKLNGEIITRKKYYKNALDEYMDTLVKQNTENTKKINDLEKNK